MKFYIFMGSPRAFKVMAVANHLGSTSNFNNWTQLRRAPECRIRDGESEQADTDDGR